MNYYKFIFVFLLLFSEITYSQNNQKDTVVLVQSCNQWGFFLSKDRSSVDSTQLVNKINFCDSIYEVSTNRFYGIIISETGVKMFEANYRDMYVDGSFVYYDSLGRKTQEGSQRQIIKRRFNTTHYYAVYDRNRLTYSYQDEKDTTGYLKEKIIVTPKKRKYHIEEYAPDGTILKSYSRKKKCGFFCTFRGSLSN